MSAPENKINADDEKKSEHAWSTCDANRLYNILPFNCLIIDIRSKEEYEKGHIWKSNSFPLTMDELKETSNDYQQITQKLTNILSAKASPSSLTTKILKRFIIVSDDRDTNQKYYTFIQSIFNRVQSEYSFTEKYELQVLSQTFNQFYKQYPFYCVITNSDQQCTYYPNAILLNKLYLGTGQQAVTSKIIKDLKITHIVNITKEIGCPFDNDEDKVKYIQIKVDDLENVSIKEYFIQVTDFMNEALKDDNNNNRVMVHCEMGVSRSSSFVLVYLMKYKGMRLCEAYQHTKKCRQIIHPNNGFFKQLIAFEVDLYGKSTDNVITEELKLREINVDQKVANLKMGLVQAIAIKKNKFHKKAKKRKTKNNNYKKDDKITFKINDEELKGTIRWIGESEKWDKGIWFGVELDSENLVYGHDGGYNQERFFGCADKFGVYIKQEQIQNINTEKK